MAEQEQQKKMQLVFIPSPGVGHLAAMVELADLLVHRHATLSVSVLIITTPSTAATVTRYTDSLAASPRLTLLHLPNDDTHPAAAGGGGGDISIIESQKPRVREAVSAILTRSHDGDAPPPSVAGFVLDMFCTSMSDVADEFGVPSYIFFTSAASALGFILHIQSLHDGDEGFDVTEFEGTELAFPSWAHPVPRWAFPSNVMNKEWVHMLYKISRDFRKAKGILVNTVKELESYAVDSLSSSVGNNHHLSLPKVYPVGPILNLKGSNEESKSRGNEAIEWLDRQPESSVVFLCFGSMGAFREDQVREIARGLEGSGQRFLWSLRRPGQGGPRASPTDYEDVREVLPEGFVDRTAEVGRVIGWAPQAKILAHKSIGGFVSHCGWNSTLESLWFGVPMTTWPMYAEQRLNAFLLVNELEIATEMKMDYRSDSGEIVTAEEIERGIKRLMVKDCTREERMEKFSDHIKMALMDGGSSSSSIAEFIEDASKGCM